MVLQRPLSDIEINGILFDDLFAVVLMYSSVYHFQIKPLNGTDSLCIKNLSEKSIYMGFIILLNQRLLKFVGSPNFDDFLYIFGNLIQFFLLRSFRFLTNL